MSEASVNTFDPQQETVLMTPAAISHVKKYLAAHPEAIGIHLHLEKRGCSGMAYVMTYLTELNQSDLKFPQASEIMLYVDSSCIRYVKGTIIDYVKEGLNNKFVYQNPNVQGECGCGESFSV